ncbi:MAG: DUF4192 domain-containing protein [Jatrophihabitans sp.]|uniref:DUF4192 domain-containing protein n=1 Tax=Jatrophihabitans sp. TaxID=1932789 RepID=UPI00390EED3B
MNTESRADSLRSSCRISGPGELLQAIPYLLGFHPAESLVLVGLHDGRLVVTARVDLIDASTPEMVSHTLDAMVRGGSTSVLAAIYDDSFIADRFIPLHVPDVLVAAERAGCELLEVLVVSAGRWWSVLCEPGCCPPEGRALPSEPSAFAVAATFDGVVAMPDRAALASVLDPVGTVERVALLPLLAAAERVADTAAANGQGERLERSVKRALFAAARASGAPGWAGPEEATVARFGAALATAEVRNRVWMAVDDGRLDGRPLWRDLGRRLPPPYDAAPLFLFGWAAWRSGDGTLAGIAAERAVASDPDCSVADLLLAALSHGLDPRRFPKLRPPVATTRPRGAGPAEAARRAR